MNILTVYYTPLYTKKWTLKMNASYNIEKKTCHNILKIGHLFISWYQIIIILISKVAKIWTFWQWTIPHPILLHIWNHRPSIAYSLYNFQVAAVTIKGSLLMSLPIIKCFGAMRMRRHVTQGRGLQMTTYLQTPTPYCPHILYILWCLRCIISVIYIVNFS